MTYENADDCYDTWFTSHACPCRWLCLYGQYCHAFSRFLSCSGAIVAVSGGGGALSVEATPFATAETAWGSHQGIPAWIDDDSFADNARGDLYVRSTQIRTRTWGV